MIELSLKEEFKELDEEFAEIRKVRNAVLEAMQEECEHKTVVDYLSGHMSHARACVDCGLMEYRPTVGGDEYDYGHLSNFKLMPGNEMSYRYDDPRSDRKVYMIETFKEFNKFIKTKV